MQILHKGRDATPQFLTETDLVDVEEQLHNAGDKKRSTSIWDALVEEVEKKTFTSIADSEGGQSVHFQITDMDDITAEV